MDTMKKTLILWLALAPMLHGCAQNAETASPKLRMERQYAVRLFAPGDYGSKNYRIPAVCTLPDGTLLAVNDRRKNNEGDLPQDIDIVCRRSTDAGHTWSEPQYIMQGTGYKQGYGDAALAVCANGDVLCAFCGHNGFWQSNEEDPELIMVCRSTDGGRSWSEPHDITRLVWGSEALGEGRNYKGGFIASGNGLRLQHGAHKGRIIFVAALCRKAENVPDNFTIYSDDNGESWQVSELAYSGGDEAKAIELTDGSVLMSVRQQGARGWNISHDGGATWGRQGTWPEMTTNACNGDMLRWGEGTEQTMLLHSIPNSMQRENVSIFASYDEGKSWQDPVTVWAGPSVYSSLTMMPNGKSIGIYYEKTTERGCELWFECWEIMTD